MGYRWFTERATHVVQAICSAAHDEYTLPYDARYIINVSLPFRVEIEVAVGSRAHFLKLMETLAIIEFIIYSLLSNSWRYHTYRTIDYHSAPFEDLTHDI